MRKLRPNDINIHNNPVAQIINSLSRVPELAEHNYKLRTRQTKVAFTRTDRLKTLYFTTIKYFWNINICTIFNFYYDLVIQTFLQSGKINFKSSLIIHKENTKEITTVAMVLYVIKLHVHFPKIKSWISRLIKHLFWKFLRKWTDNMGIKRVGFEAI